MKLNRVIIGLFFTIWMCLNMAVGLYTPLRHHPIGIPYFLVMQVINMGIAYDITLLLCVSFSRDGDPPKLGRLKQRPRVALLYLSCNDAMPEALSRLNNQEYKNHHIFVLDDSTQEAYIKLVDDHDYETIHRGHRQGAKAGAINHWLSLYGERYEYFVVLDHDGIMKETFIEEMLKYAEHPDNRQVAIFQSLTRAWNISRLFPRLLDALNPMEMCLHLQVFNQSDSMLCWGHNMLCRTKTILEIGGFIEDFATEDFATNLRLLECGYQSKAVNVVSYDAASETAQFHAVRMTRWASGNLETAISKSWDLPLATRLRMFMGVHYFSQWFFYVLGMLLVVWGYRITWRQLYIASFFALRWGRPFWLLYPLAVLLFYILYGTVVRPLWVTRLTDLSWKIYWKHYLFKVAVNYYCLFYFMPGQVKSLLGRKARFIIGEKRWFKSSLWDIVWGMKWTMAVIAMIGMGLIGNPVGRMIHFVWYTPLFLSPFIVYWVQNTAVDQQAADFTPTDGLSASPITPGNSGERRI
ncbi:MAG: glycosyltransferase [Chloroflexi bacterium]|nr:glycosyltransferase [Chloroflexota bacterium]